MTTYTQAEREKMITELTVAAGLLSVGQVRDFDDLSETLACAANMLAAPSTSQPLTQKPIFWYRPTCGGEMYEGPVHDSSIGGKMMRDEKPGEWLPLFDGTTAPSTSHDALRAEVERLKDALLAEQALSAMRKGMVEALIERRRLDEEAIKGGE